MDQDEYPDRIVDSLIDKPIASMRGKLARAGHFPLVSKHGKSASPAAASLNR